MTADAWMIFASLSFSSLARTVFYPSLRHLRFFCTDLPCGGIERVLTISFLCTNMYAHVSSRGLRELEGRRLHV